MADRCRKTVRTRSAGIGLSVASTQTSRFIPPPDLGSGDFGYSVSLVQFIGLTALSEGLHAHLASDRRTKQRGGIDRLAGFGRGVD